MMPFEEWWQFVLLWLAYPRQVDNWTALNSFGRGGRFYARSYRSFTSEEQRVLTGGHWLSCPDDWIFCTQVNGSGFTKVSKKEFADRYHLWPSYRNQRVRRAEFNKDTKASPYLISIFHTLDPFLLRASASPR